MKFDPTQLDPERWWYDEEAGDEPILFIEQYLTHYEGQHAGKPFLFTDYQKDIIRQFYGVKCVENGIKTNIDRYRFLYWEGPKSLGKTPVCSGLGLYHLEFREDATPLVANMAANHKQAMNLFGRAKRHIEDHPDLAARSEVLHAEIRVPFRNATWTLRSGTKGKGKSGTPESLYILDELHEFDPNADEAIGFICENMRKRENSKMIIITNSGVDLETPCGRWHTRAEKVISGEKIEDDLLAVISCAGPDDPIGDPATWYKANPMIGVTVAEREYRNAYQKTIGDKAEELKFRRLWLAQWTRSDKQWLDPEDIKKCIVEEIPDEVKQLPLWIGFDYAPTDDITAAVYLWADKENDVVWMDCKMWIPRDAAMGFERSNGIPYSTWGAGEDEQGNPIEPFINLVNAKGFSGKHKMQMANEIFDVVDGQARIIPQQLCYDRYQATEVATTAELNGIVAEAITSHAGGIGEACREFSSRIMTGTIKIKRNPCLLWQLEQVAFKLGNNNIGVPIQKGGDKDNVRKKDAVMAAMYAMARVHLYMLRGEEVDNSMKIEDWDGIVPFV